MTAWLTALLIIAAAGVSGRPLESGDDQHGAENSGWSKTERFKADKPRYRRDREIDVLHLRLDITPDLEKQSFSAEAELRFRVLAVELATLELDARELEIKKVSDEKGTALDFEVRPEKLLIHFPKKPASGSEHTVKVEYSAVPRRLGLHFFKQDPRYPGQPDALWSQGEAEQNSYWIPMVDYPNEMSTTELLATVPDGFAAISNGRLVSRQPGKKSGTTVFHWLQDKPHVGYLITLSIGRYSAVDLSAGQPALAGATSAVTQVPMTVWVPPGQEDRARLTFAKTPAMVTYYSDLLGASYPWDKYDQIIVYQFFGGMENTSATNILDRALLDKRAAVDYDSDGLISHELAHQWFGDLITCKDWSHLWLNEGFASYFQAVWKAKDLGADEFAYDLQEKASSYFSEGHSRAIVTDRYEEPDDMFDRHTYEKGAWVLQMLRKELGEDRFWRVIKRYVQRHKHAVAETEDLRQVIEEITGKTFVEFFAQWLYGEGHPQLKLKAEWDHGDKKLTFRVTQKQAKGGPLFKFKLPLEIHSKGASKKKISVDKAEESSSWDFPSRPTMIRVDPELTLLAAYELDFPQDMLLEQLKRSADVPGRIRAAKALAKSPDAKVLEALKVCALKDSFWGVAAACARELGGIGGPRALEALKLASSVKHPKVRRAVAQSLGGFLLQKEAYEILKPLAEKDESYFVESAALSSLGSLRLPEAKPLLESKLNTDSWNEMIRRAALTGLGRLHDEAALPLLKHWSSPGKVVLARQSALFAYADAGEGKEGVRDALAMILESEEDRAIRGSAIAALINLGDPKANSALARVAARDSDPEMRRRASNAMEAIREGKKGKIEDLTKKLDDFNEKVDRLEKKLDELEKKKK